MGGGAGRHNLVHNRDSPGKRGKNTKAQALASVLSLALQVLPHPESGEAEHAPAVFTGSGVGWGLRGSLTPWHF